MRNIVDWMRLRIEEPSTWAGAAMVAIVLGIDPMKANSMAQAVSLILGGGLMSAGPLGSDEERR